ncbi:MAG: glycine--tRNA ligase subunit beta [Chloroflexota bacterium]|nr:glycine--tRNA ligase subunit beta [Chloroflexota bacterium]
MEERRSLTFQQVILRLEQFWARQGCLIWQPYSEKVGAGTMNPATALRVLGPEPWRVAYVEPSYRPADGRYGENPNRMQMFIQYQVILKPDPGNPQEIYLESLEALGINRREHDLRFVEDNWESPVLGAWGLGWEVWMDGQEITQFTYFQQAGGVALEVPAVEITYGLERIVMPLQGVRSVWGIDWDGTRTYGDVLLRGEVEHCTYDFELADVERLERMYDLYEAEAQSCLERDLVIPAHDYILRCSHTFNVLDARGAIGVTERAHYFARMRELSRQVAEAYLKQREELECPWCERPSVVASQRSSAQGHKRYDAKSLSRLDAVLEIGTEELPAQDVTGAIEQLRERLPAMLADVRLDYEDIWASGTPRRLAAIVKGLAARQTEREQVVKGPPVKVAYDAQDNPTRAAEGFARSQKVPVESLQAREMDGGRYVVAVRAEPGRPAAEVLAEELPALITSLRFPMVMRWNETGATFSRPIRWLVALHGQRVIPFAYAGVTSGRTTRGLRPEGSPELELASASDYLPTMRAQGITVDASERRAEIRRQIDALAAEVEGVVPEDPELLDEVTNLVEQPKALRGEFSPQYLTLPSEVLITAMKKHQRYFPLVQVMSQRETGNEGDNSLPVTHSSLLPYFITVRNGDTTNQEGVCQGNEEVLRARLADAAFFFDADASQPLEDFLPRLDTLIFQERLGSMLDKAQRLEGLVPALAKKLRLSERDRSTARRAAHLCKADLATQVVIEFTSLQGVMGREYAMRSGESEEVARAIFEHYLPRFAGDDLPETKPGILLSLADRLDSLLGLFATGLAPTGSADPYSLRRAAIGMIQVLVEREVDLDLREGLALTAEQLPIPADEAVQGEVLSFVEGRLEGWLREQGYRYDVVAAVLTERGHNPYLAAQTVKGLAPWVEHEDWMDTLNAYSRCVHIVREFPACAPVSDHLCPIRCGQARADRKDIFSLDPSLFVEPATEELYRAYRQAAERISSESSIGALLEELRAMIPAITCFFDDVLVMCEDRSLRENRLALLQRIAALPRGIVDLSEMEGF